MQKPLKGVLNRLRYLFDEDATAAAHDSEGYYKTGDIARREGKYYWIMGRASVDSTYYPACMPFAEDS